MSSSFSSTGNDNFILQIVLLNATIFSSGCFISYKSFVLTVEEIQLWRGSGVVEKKKISKKFSKNWDTIHLTRVPRLSIKAQTPNLTPMFTLNLLVISSIKTISSDIHIKADS